MIFEDGEGQSLSGLPAARVWAIADAQNLVDEGALEGVQSAYSIEITDAAGSRLATVPVARVIKQGVGRN